MKLERKCIKKNERVFNDALTTKYTESNKTEMITNSEEMKHLKTGDRRPSH